jgi:hypothetical protein
MGWEEGNEAVETSHISLRSANGAGGLLLTTNVRPWTFHLFHQ